MNATVSGCKKLEVLEGFSSMLLLIADLGATQIQSVFKILKTVSVVTLPL